MAQPKRELPDFADLYKSPTIERMLDELTDAQFEDFVGYVFQQAGFQVEDTATQYGQGLDLKLFSGPVRSLDAGVSVKHFSPGTSVTGPQVMNFRGALGSAGAARGYVVTTNTFNPAARAGAERRPPDIWLIDGDHLIRYITYLRGSRPKPNPSGNKNPIPLGNPSAPIPPDALLKADSITRRPARETRVLVVANHKGGVGKTTTALNLAFGLASKERDQQVLLVDFDPQMNITRTLAHPQAGTATAMHIGEYFAGQRHLAELVRATQFKRVWLIPADNDLVHSDRGLSAGPDAELAFVRDLHAQDIRPPQALDERGFDWIIIDTGPSMGLFTRAAFAAAHFALMPLEPSIFADMGLDLFTETVYTMQALTGKSITVLGALVTQWKEDRLNQDLLARAEQHLHGAGFRVLETKIPLDKNNIEKAHLETAAGRQRTLLHHTCAAAKAYIAVTEEVVNHVNAAQ